MAKKISGITVEIGGDTTKLGKALKDVNAQSKTINSELREVNRLLKFEPGSTVLLEQKQKLLAESIDNTKQKLETLKEAEKQAQEQVANGESDEAYRALQREIVKTESQLKSLESQSKELGTTLSRNLEQAAEKMETLGQAATEVGSAFMPLSAAAIAAGTASVITFSNFDDAMRQVQATMGGTEEELNRLTAAAKQMGADTRFSASEAANALNYLALAGYDADTAIETLPKVLRLAAAGGLDLAYASDLVTDSMAALGKDVSEVDEFIDKMARTSQRSNTNVAQLGEATLVVAGQAGLAKMELTELNTALGVLADNGIKGSEGGTALRNVLKNLMNPTSQGAAALEELGVAMYDTDGNVRELRDVLRELDVSLSALSDEDRAAAMGAIFDSRTISAVSALLKDCGGRWDELSESIDDAEGTAQSMSDTMESGIGGAFRELKSGMEAVAIAIGETLAPMVENATRHLKSAAEWFTSLSEEQREFIVGVGLLVAAIGPVLIFVGKVAGGISQIMDLGAKLSKGMGVLSKGVGLLSKAMAFLAANPVALVIAAVAALVAGIVYLWKTNEDFRNAVLSIWESIKAGIGSAVEVVTSFFTETLPTAGQTVAEFFTVTIPEAFGVFLTFLGDLPGQLMYLLGFALGVVVGWIGDMWQSVATGVPEIISLIGTFFSQLPGNIWTFLVDTVKGVVQWGLDMGASAAEASSLFLSSVGSFFSELPGKVGQWLGNALSNIKGWGGDILSWAASSLPGIVGDVVSYFGGIPKEMLSIGADAIKGLWEGIKGMGGWIGDQISGFCGNLVQGFKDSFKIKSPSRVMAGIGTHIMEGLSVGMEDAEAQPLSRAAYVAENILEETKAAAKGASRVLTGGGTVAPSSVDNRKQVTNHYTFQSPKALTPIEARRQMQKAQRTILLDV